MTQVAAEYGIMVRHPFECPAGLRLGRYPGFPIRRQYLVVNDCWARRKPIQVQDARPERVHDFTRLLSETPVAVGMERERLPVLEPPQPPFHTDTSGSRPHRLA